MASDKGEDQVQAAGVSASWRVKVVLDTNAVLDWMVFDDPSLRPIAALITTGHWQWLGSTETVQELATVLHRPGLELWQERLAPALGLARQHCRLMSQPTPPRTMNGLVCSDPDDQKFIDFAVTQGAALLFTRDKALLRLARPALAHGVRVLRPMDWLGTV